MRAGEVGIECGKMQPKDKRRWSLAWTAAAWVALIALLAAGGLFVLERWHNQAAHQLATQAVAERGQWLAMSLALRAAAAADASGAEEAADGGGWREFSGVLRSLREVENDLEFVSVRREEVTLFQEHADEMGSGDGATNYYFEGPVVLGRQRLSGQDGQVPVVTFSVTVSGPDGKSIVLELGLRRGAVEREEWAATRAIESMYRLSLAAMGVCFAICLVLVAGMAHREERRERARRREEHLAFSGMLANGIVHDFRNPMSSLRLDAQMLEKEAGKGGEARVERLGALAGRMRHTLDRMERVFQEFLTLARPGEDKPVRIDLGSCARECLEMLAPRFEAAGVTPELHSAGGGASVRVSEASVKRALLNIFMNAIQHSGSGGKVVVEVNVREGRAILEVCDTGPGIPRADREKVFEMFYTTRPQGTGLGLFLARTAIENNGGRLTAEEPRGAGARLCMELPLSKETPS